jgi:hypothetical protein
MTSAINEFLGEFDRVPEEDRTRTLSAEDLNKIVVILTYTVSDLAEKINELKEENEKLRRALGPTTGHFGKNLFAISSWRTLKSANDVREAQSFLETHFAKILDNKQCRSLVSSIVGLMSSVAHTPALLEQDSFVESARTLMTELLVALEKKNGWRDQALEALRSSLLGVSLPSEISSAYEHARLTTKMAQRPQPPKPNFRHKKFHRPEGRGGGPTS